MTTFFKKLRKKLAQYSRPWSYNYWDNRYLGGGNSGGGSYGKLALFKNQVITEFCNEHEIKQIIEFGSGDGNQASLLPANIIYNGLDVSKTAVEMCRARFKNDPNKRFMIFSGKRGFCKKYHLSAPLTLSLDVLYHLVEDSVFENYLSELFESSTRYVIIYSSDKETAKEVQHVRHRKFTDYVSAHFPQFKLIRHISNDFSPEKGLDEQSFADFYIYEIIS